MASRNTELCTAVSYYLLYRSLASSTHSIPDVSEESSLSEDRFWRDDKWTEQDNHAAERILRQHEAKCFVPEKRIQQFEREATRNWNNFYQNHGTKFFNDRHYLSKAFPQEFGDAAKAETRSLVEIGCGVGNNILPLLERCPNWKIWGYDLSDVAIELLLRDRRFDSSRTHAAVWDISVDPPPVQDTADICTLLFCLSSIAPEKMKTAARHVAATMKHGGVLVIRDYGRYDEAQLKLGVSRAKRLSDNFYVKSDGTRCYYFSLQDMEQLFVDHAGLRILELKYICRVYENRAKDEKRRRIWVQGRFQKPTLLHEFK